MKTVLYSFILVVMGDAFAQTAKDSWTTIRNDKKVKIVMPKFSDQFGPDGIFNICNEGGEFKNIYPVTTCTEYIDIKSGIPNSDIGEMIIKKCITTTEIAVSVPRITSRQICSMREESTEDSSNKCIVWQNVTSSLPLDYTLDVIHAKGNEKYSDLKFRKNYTIPECSLL